LIRQKSAARPEPKRGEFSRKEHKRVQKEHKKGRL
jgi:hypothetical protein